MQPTESIHDLTGQQCYRIIVQGYERCIAPSAIKAQIFPDNKTARIYIAPDSSSAQVGAVHDIRSVGKGVTVIDYYMGICLICTEEFKQKHIKRLKRWINEGSTSCD
ncbi:MAG: hypothetical protein IT510_00490 [Sulfuritalea sp.]|nr:hypothetical protein [Sulfuritalea sp.]